jgi:hypothetical protein
MIGLVKLSAEALYAQFGALMAQAPDLRRIDDRYQIPEETMRWLARGVALVDAIPGISLDSTQLKLAIDGLIRTQGGGGPAQQVMAILMRAMAAVELATPARHTSSFISAGAGFDAVATLSKICGTAERHILLVDPYMDAAALTGFAVYVPEGVTVRLLADEQSVKPGLAPAAAAWIAQHGVSRPITVCLAPRRSLHDRLILVDDQAAWILTQSLAHFAARSPATIQGIDPATAAMKHEAYQELWANGRVIAQSGAYIV